MDKNSEDRGQNTSLSLSLILHLFQTHLLSGHSVEGLVFKGLLV